MAVSRPASASHFPTDFLVLCGGLVALWGLQQRDAGALLFNSLAVCVAMAAVLAASDILRFRVHRRPSADLAWETPRAPDLQRVGVQLLGLVGTLAIIGLGYWAFPEYHGAFYDPFWTVLRTCGPWLLLASPIYFWMMDRVERDPYDSYWEVGMLFVGRRPSNWGRIAQHFGGWVVKGFFLPLMTVSLGRELAATWDWLHHLHDGGLAWYDFLFHVSYLVDLLFCVMGYAVTLRVLDSHIRSTEPTAGGWVVALMCYQPFYSVFDTQYLRYEDGYYWSTWLAPYPMLRGVWAIAILVLLVIYSLSTASFGLRFSNLTHRGIITAGPYRFSKHPAYISKNLSWWMISIPFISQQSWQDAVRNSLALGVLNLIYFLRAKTEERHLSRDPDYVAYATWIDRHGLLRGLGRLIPALRYRPPPVSRAA